MKIVKLGVGEVKLTPLTWKQKKECMQMAEIANGQVKNSILYEQAEYIMCDKEEKWIDDLTIQDGEKLREAVMIMWVGKGDASKK